MPSLPEYIVIGVIVLAAALWLGRRFVRWVRGTGGGCGSRTPAKPKKAMLTIGGKPTR